MRNLILNMFLSLLCCLLSVNTFSQDTLKKTVRTHKDFKNVVRFNYSNQLFFGPRSIIFGYERVFGKHQSVSMNIGQAALPISTSTSLTLGDVVLSKEIKDQSGLHFSVDYRYYFKKENRYPAPRGIYFGPYFTYNLYRRENYLTLDSPTYSGDLTTNYKLGILTGGIQMGYQFVLWNRLALDFIMVGPGIAYYLASASTDANLNTTDRETVLNAIHDALSEKIPGYTNLVNKENFSVDGKSSTNGLGYRFVFHLGFCF